MDTETSELQVDDRGTPFDVTFQYRDSGRSGNDRISVILRQDGVKPPIQRHKFRVSDADEGECVFTGSNVDGESKPSRAALKALSKKGWICTNYTLERIQREDYQNVAPSLQYADDMLAGILKLDVDHVAKHPFLLDVLETAVSAIAFVNSPVQVEANGGESFLAELIEADDERIQTLRRDWIIAECHRDPYLRLFLPQLAAKHYGMRIDDEMIDNFGESVDDPQLARLVNGIGSRSDDNYRPSDFDGTRWGDRFE